MRISISSLSGWDYNDVRRCRIWILIVWIIIDWRYWYSVVRPPEWAVDAPNDYSTEKSSEYGPSWCIPSVIVSTIATIIMASARVSTIPTSSASGMRY